jgi:hypothetical protein
VAFVGIREKPLRRGLEEQAASEGAAAG